jgi:hypothetical protein
MMNNCSTKLSTWALPIHSILIAIEPAAAPAGAAAGAVVALARCGALCAGPDRRASAVSIAVLWHLLA